MIGSLSPLPTVSQLQGDTKTKMPRIIVRVWLSRDRAREAECELKQLLGGERPYRQGTSRELLWDFANLELAQMFKVQAEHTPGVQRIEIS
jgi:hypothetical protein